MKSLLIELGAQDFDEELSKGFIITNTICHNLSDGKMKLYYYFEDKYFHCYTACQKNYNIIDLVISNFKLRGIVLTFTDSIRWICEKLGRSFVGSARKSGFQQEKKENEALELMKKIKKKRDINRQTFANGEKLQVFSDRILTLFTDFKHDNFLEDGISEEAMDRFDIKYSPEMHKIIVPHRRWSDGKLLGMKGRALNEIEIEKGYKYIPVKVGEIQYAYPTYFNLYGFYQNKETIKRLGKVAIFESEKSVLQIDTIYPENNFAVALSGSNMSKYQADILIKSGVKEAILCLDKEYTELEGKDFELYQKKIIRIAKLLNKYCTVYVCYDTQNMIELKSSPSDHGKEILEKLMKQKEIIQLEE